MIYLQLIRYKNLIIIAIMFMVIKFGFLNLIVFQDQQGIMHSFENNQYLDLFQYFLLLFATLLIMAGGYIINDVFDVGSDLINKPKKVLIGKHITEKTAYNLYFILNILGVLIGFYLSRVVHHGGFAAIFVIASALLFAYSNGLKSMPLIGNIIISILSVLSILVVVMFNLLPAMHEGNKESMLQIFGVLKHYAIFAFLLQFIREIIKTIEDIDGDKAYGVETIATNFNLKTVKIITFSLIILLFGFISYYAFTNLLMNTLAITYFIIFMLLPIVYIAFLLFNATLKTHFTKISFCIKLVMLSTIFSITASMLAIIYA